MPPAGGRDRAPELAAWAAALVAYAVASAALAWGAAAGWDARAFRVYYLFGGLLTAPLLGLGSLLLTRRRWALWPALVYVGLAIGVAIAVPMSGEWGSSIPAAQDHLDFFPARLVALVGNLVGTAAVVACGNCHDQAPAARKRTGPCRRRCCRRWNRSIRLGSGENGCFCGNCSTSSLRRIYSFVAL